MHVLRAHAPWLILRSRAGARLRPIACAALIAAAAGCAPTVTNHGWRLDEAAITRIRPGETSREEVQAMLGSPSSVATFGGTTWYYVAQTTASRSFYENRVDAQDVLRVDFDESGIVRGMDRHGLEMAQAVDPADEKTRTLGNELTLVQQFVGNIGRFNTGDASSQAASAARRGPTAPGGGF